MEENEKPCKHENCEVSAADRHLYCCECGKDLDQDGQGRRERAPINLQSSHDRYVRAWNRLWGLGRIRDADRLTGRWQMWSRIRKIV
jgi:hypothetical protein